MQPGLGGPPPFYHFYRLVAGAALPLAWRRVRARLSAEGIAPARQRERLGHATADRPEGPLIWVHAASVGEGVSSLALIQRLMALCPGVRVLLTSGTAGSARVLGPRMPKGAVHQFAPLDAPGPLRRFFAHWRPDAAIFVESELWPQMLVQAHRRGVPLALVNARLSRASLRNWGRFDTTFRYLMGLFSLVRTQDGATLDGLLSLGADAGVVQRGPNLKSMVLPPPTDPATLAALRADLPGPLWAAVSTHEGEEEAVIAAHLHARTACPGLRLLLAPRHPTRGDAVETLLRDAGLSYARRSTGAAPGTAEVYLADTLGEVGLWYSLAPVTFLGGSFGPAGGHTPYEPALFDTAILHGPRVANFDETYARFDADGAARTVADGEGLGHEVARLLADPATARAMGDAARAISAEQGSRLDEITAELIAALGLSALSSATQTG